MRPIHWILLGTLGALAVFFIWDNAREPSGHREARLTALDRDRLAEGQEQTSGEHVARGADTHLEDDHGSGSERSPLGQSGFDRREFEVLALRPSGEDLAGVSVSAHARGTEPGGVSSRAREDSSWTPGEVVTTDGRGRASLRHFEPQDSWILWASHPFSRAVLVRLEEGTFAREGQARVVLAPCDPLVVRVVDGAGKPVPGARVVQRFPTSPDALAAGSSSETSHVAGLTSEDLGEFERQFVADERGVALAHPAALTIQLSASSVDSISRPKLVDPSEREVVLELQSPAKAMGTVHLPPGIHATEGIVVRIFERDARLEGEADLRWLAGAEVAPDGAWGPSTFAHDSSRALVFRVEGRQIVPEEKQLDPGRGTPPYVVDFTPELGHALRVRVFTRSGGDPIPVPGARVDFLYRSDDGRVRQVSAWSDSEGACTLGGCPRTSGVVRAGAAGFAPAEISSVGLPRLDDVEIELARGGILFGRCTYDDRPVEDFDVYLWRRDPRERVHFSFRDRHEGRFQIDGAPLGRIQAFASSPHHPESAVQSLELGPDFAVELRFDLPVAVRGRGQVVDGGTSAPLAHARVRSLVTVSTVQVAERGPVFPVRADGSFELDAFPPHDTSILVEADGYGARRATGSMAPDGGIEFGRIALSPAQTLEVRLVTSATYDASHLWFLGEGPMTIPFTPFPAEGRLLVNDVIPGTYAFNVLWQDGAGITCIMELVAGRAWSLVLELDPRSLLRVEIVNEDGSKSAESMFVYVIPDKEQEGYRAWATETDRDGIAEFRDLPGRDFVVDARDMSSRTRAFTRVRLPSEEGEQRILVRLIERSLGVLVTDVEGRALPGAQLDFAHPNRSSSWTIYHETDADGRVELKGLAIDALLMNAYHSVAGSVSNRIVQLAPRGRTEVEVVLGGGEELAVRVLEEGRPAAGVGLNLHPSVRSILISSRQTDGEGRALWSRMEPGAYQVQVNASGYWPSWHAFEFAAGGSEVQIEALRLGDLLLRLRDAEGHALPGLAVEAIALELGEAVSSWVAGRRIHARPAELRTDHAGELRLQGIPRGPYKLSIQTPAGEWVERELRVPGGRVLEEVVVLE